MRMGDICAYTQAYIHSSTHKHRMTLWMILVNRFVVIWFGISFCFRSFAFIHARWHRFKLKISFRFHIVKHCRVTGQSNVILLCLESLEMCEFDFCVIRVMKFLAFFIRMLVSTLRWPLKGRCECESIKHKHVIWSSLFLYHFFFFTIDECSTDSNEMNILWVPIFRLHTHNLGYRFRLQSFCNFTTNENHSKSCRSISLTKDKFMGHKNWKSEAKRSTRITKDKWKENCRIQERNELELINGISTWKTTRKWIMLKSFPESFLGYFWNYLKSHMILMEYTKLHCSTASEWATRK